MSYRFDKVSSWIALAALTSDRTAKETPIPIRVRPSIDDPEHDVYDGLLLGMGRVATRRSPGRDPIESVSAELSEKSLGASSTGSLRATNPRCERAFCPCASRGKTP